MSFFKRTPKSPVQIGISAPESISQDDVFLDIEVGLNSETEVVKPVVKARLRADLTDKKKARGAAQFYLLGEMEYVGEVAVVPGHPETISLRIPLDFSPMSLFDIPTANIAQASPEMQAAMTAAQEIKHLYAYSVEVIIKTQTGEFSQSIPVDLIRPESTRIGQF